MNRKVVLAFGAVNIVELATGITGPYLAMLLADPGAEVVKVEPPEGDPSRGTPGSLVWNRGKRSLRLDFSRHQAREIVHRLIGKCDGAGLTRSLFRLKQKRIDCGGICKHT
jgi:crotonobetainyl-CoA:carnitine CoA-transferase CaiB-like acyl-CoA transferase